MLPGNGADRQGVQAASPTARTGNVAGQPQQQVDGRTRAQPHVALCGRASSDLGVRAWIFVAWPGGSLEVACAAFAWSPGLQAGPGSQRASPGDRKWLPGCGEKLPGITFTLIIMLYIYI